MTSDCNHRKCNYNKSKPKINKIPKPATGSN